MSPLFLHLLRLRYERPGADVDALPASAAAYQEIFPPHFSLYHSPSRKAGIVPIDAYREGHARIAEELLQVKFCARAGAAVVPRDVEGPARSTVFSGVTIIDDLHAVRSALRALHKGVTYKAEVDQPGFAEFLAADELTEIGRSDRDSSFKELLRSTSRNAAGRNAAIDAGVDRKSFIARCASHMARDDTALRAIIATDRKVRRIRLTGSGPVEPLGADRLAIHSLSWQRATHGERDGHGSQQQSTPECVRMEGVLVIADRHLFIHGLHSLSNTQ